jgi:plastocyanin
MYRITHATDRRTSAAAARNLLRKLVPAIALCIVTTTGIPGAGATAAAAEREAVVVRIADYRFEPADITVAVGTTVRWVNEERRTSHDVFFPDDGTASQRLFPGEDWSRLFDTPGSYPYHCQPHPGRPGMHGVVTVLPTSATDAELETGSDGAD